jgi:hypothetical protein
MARQGTKSKAYEDFGIVCANPRWGWSGHSIDKSKVALLFWEDKFDETKGLYDDTDWPDPSTTHKLGNKERIKDIKLARRRSDSVVHAVIARAKLPITEPRKIDRAYAMHRFKMKITDFDEETGKFRAERVPADVKTDGVAK